MQTANQTSVGNSVSIYANQNTAQLYANVNSVQVFGSSKDAFVFLSNTAILTNDETNGK